MQANTFLLYRRLLTFLFLFSLPTLNCKKSNSPVEPTPTPSGPGTVQTTGSLSLPPQTNPSELTLKAGMNEGVIKSDGSYEIKLNPNTVQAITVLKRNGEPLLLSIAATGTQTTNQRIDATSTAEALLFLNPLFCTSVLSEATQLKDRIRLSTAFQQLVTEIDNQLKAGTFSITDANQRLNQALKSAFEEIMKSLESSSLNKLNRIGQIQGDPNPSIEVNGLRVVEYSRSGSSLSFRINNRFKRWISIYVDSSVDGTNFQLSNTPADLIPSPGISIWGLLTQGTSSLSEKSVQLGVNTANYQRVLVKCYGLGVGRNLSLTERQRVILPSAASAVFDLAVPLFEVLVGASLQAELRGRPSSHPFYQLVVKVQNTIANAPDDIARLVRYSQEGNISGILDIYVTACLRECSNNPSLLTDLLVQIVGPKIVRSVVDSWLFPIRVINLAITGTNIVYTLSSILATEAVTTFTFDQTTTTLPIQCFGVAKDVTTLSPVNGATITVFDARDVPLVATNSDAAGQFNFRTSAGSIRLRIVANKYKPVDQFLQVPSSPITYYAPTTWLSKYSNEAGTVIGIVRDATTTNPIAGVQISLKYGVNDPFAQTIKDTISLNNGLYRFSSIPSGTYTAYFTKQGYVSDFLVLSAIGGETRTGNDMNLSPDIRTSGGYRIVLTWGFLPYDLDSHLITPSIGGRTYHIYFASKGSLTSPPYANLDVDDVTSYGPETITIGQIFPGVYQYSVYQYSSEGSLTTSNGRVALYGTSGLIRVWNVPLSGSGRWWNVFTLDGSTGSITSLNSISTAGPSGRIIGFPQKVETSSQR